MNSPGPIGWAGIVLVHTPPYVWFLLLAALVLGARRLKPRRTHLAAAALPPGLFLIGGIYSAASSGADPGSVALLWGACFAIGAASSPVRLVRRPRQVSGFVFDFAATAWVLAAYLLIFAAHYALGIWAGFAPQLSPRLSLAGLGLSALTAGRTSADFTLLVHMVAVPPNFRLRRPWLKLPAPRSLRERRRSGDEAPPFPLCAERSSGSRYTGAGRR